MKWNVDLHHNGVLITPTLMPYPNNTSTFSNRHSNFLSFPSLGFSPEFTSPSPDIIKAQGEQLFLQIIKIDLKIHSILQNTQPASLLHIIPYT